MRFKLFSFIILSTFLLSSCFTTSENVKIYFPRETDVPGWKLLSKNKSKCLIKKLNFRKKCLSQTYTRFSEPKRKQAGRKSTKARVILNKGPAIDILNSSAGFSGIDLIAAIPPIGSKIICSTLIPKCLACKLWHNSWQVTQRNTKRIRKIPRNP